MRTTVRIDDDLMPQLKQRAEAAGESVTKALNRLLRRGIAAELNGDEQKKKAFKQRTFSMGEPLIDITKAHAILLERDDIERMQKVERQLSQTPQDEADRH